MTNRVQDFRVGIGYDVHKLKKGRKLILGGVQIAYPRGLEGHSDADVLVHAVMDALLGAAGLEDIGVHFPDTEARYKDISSLRLLGQVWEKIQSQGKRIVNIDAVIIAQKPKVSPYLAGMKKNMASVLGIQVQQIGIKATTTEMLGFIGRSEGVAAQSVVLLQ